MCTCDISWWYWTATVGLLAGGLAGCPYCVPLAALLTAVQAAHFARHFRSLTAFPVQVRAAYLGLLALGAWEPLRALWWIQLAGTSAIVLFDYCLLARAISLLPWNRRGPLTARLVGRTFLAPPQKGNSLQGLSGLGNAHAEPEPVYACSLRARPVHAATS